MAPKHPAAASSSSASPPTSPPRPDEAPLRQSKVVSFNRGPSPMGRPHLDIIDDQSPRIYPRMSTEEDPLLKIPSPIGSDEWHIDEIDENSKSTWFLFILTLCGLGLQIGWSVETSNGSPYLLSLGLSKSMLALVWIAGPLSGVLVQPYVGLKSDNCRIRWGKRRPFILGGAFATILSLLILAWAKELVGGFLGIFGADKESQGVKTCTMLFAVLFVYVLDFAINVIQAAIRAYIVDVTPTHQQEAANAWFMRSSGIGNILGYLAGNVKLVDYFSFLGDSQFKILCAIASFIMALTTGISCSSCPERNPKFDGESESNDSVFGFFRSLARSVRNLPPQIKRVCEVQFFAWIGWFPFLFYITTYVGEIYVDPQFTANPNMTDAEIDQVWEDATRVGTRALLVFAITTFASSVFLPFIIPPTYQAPDPSRPATPATPMTPRSMSGSGYFSLKDTPKGPSKSIFQRFLSRLDKLQIQSLTLRRSWMISHIMFAVLMGATFFIGTTLGATILVGLIGVPWALTGWAPFALIASEISKRDAMRRGVIRPRSQDAALVAAGHDEAAETGADQAGVVLGIHNVAIAAPQVIATLVSSIIFRMLQKPRGTPGDNSVAWVLRFGGCCALIAAWYTLRVHEEKEDVDALEATVRARRNS